MYSRNQAGFSGIDQVVCLLAGVVGIVIGVVIGAVLYIAKLPISAVRMLIRNRDFAVAEAHESTAIVTQSSILESSVEEVPLEAADRVKQFNVGALAKVHCRFYSEADVVTRHVFFLSQDAIAKVGKRVDLAPLRTSVSDLAQIERSTAQEIQALLDLAGSKPSDNLVAKEAIVEPAEVAQYVETAPALKPKAPNVRPRQRMASYQGVLLNAGVQTRKTSKSKYDAFCLTFDDEALGAEHQLWGADLERAIEESGSQAGDRVRVELVGETPTVVKGKTVTKKIWQITKL